MGALFREIKSQIVTEIYDEESIKKYDNDPRYEKIMGVIISQRIKALEEWQTRKPKNVSLLAADIQS